MHAHTLARLYYFPTNYSLQQKMSLIMVCPEIGWIFIVLYQAHIPCRVTHMKCYVQLKTNQYTQAPN